MLYDEFLGKLDKPVVIHLSVGGQSFYSVFGADVSKVTQVIPDVQMRTFPWNGQEMPFIQRLIYPLDSDAAALSAAGYQVYTCRPVAGICHRPRQETKRSDRRAVPPPGYTAVTVKNGQLQRCPVCKQRDGWWWGPDKSASGENVIFQCPQAQAMYAKVTEDRADWNWLSSLLYKVFTPEHVWRLMGNAPMWSDIQYYVDGSSLVGHWSRYVVGGCACGAKFWHDWGQPHNYYIKVPTTVNKPKPAKTTKAVPVEVNNGQLTMF